MGRWELRGGRVVHTRSGGKREARDPEVWAERVARLRADGHRLPADAARLAWEGLQGCPPSSRASHAGQDDTHA